jgi:hypothetical protein
LCLPTIWELQSVCGPAIWELHLPILGLEQSGHGFLSGLTIQIHQAIPGCNKFGAFFRRGAGLELV